MTVWQRSKHGAHRTGKHLLTETFLKRNAYPIRNDRQARTLVVGFGQHASHLIRCIHSNEHWQLNNLASTGQLVRAGGYSLSNALSHMHILSPILVRVYVPSYAETLVSITQHSTTLHSSDGDYESTEQGSSLLCPVFTRLFRIWTTTMTNGKV